MRAETPGRAIKASALGRAAPETPPACPLPESVHIFGIALLPGAAAAMDLPLPGHRRGRIAPGALAATLTPPAPVGPGLVGPGLAPASGAGVGAAAASIVPRSDAPPAGKPR